MSQNITCSSWKETIQSSKSNFETAVSKLLLEDGTVSVHEEHAMIWDIWDLCSKPWIIEIIKEETKEKMLISLFRLKNDLSPEREIHPRSIPCFSVDPTIRIHRQKSTSKSIELTRNVCHICIPTLIDL